jgi:putative DNA primase/helicase
MTNESIAQKQPRPKIAMFPEVEPVGFEVDGDWLLSQIVEVLQRHVVLPRGAAEAVALWIIFTYAIEAFDIAPLLAILSPVKGCGKTTLLLMLRALVHRPQVASNISPAALFRIIDRYHPTLLIDEIDTQLSRGNEELRGILNAGHTRTGAIVIRASGKDEEGDYEPRVFDVWAAKVLAGIGRLPPTVQDRAVTIAMRRRMPHEPVERLRQDRIETQYGEFYRMFLQQWADDHVAELRNVDPVMPGQLSDLGCDNWRPLLAIADAIGGDWPGRAREAALLLNHSAATEEDEGTLLLTDLKELFETRGESFLLSDEIVKDLCGLEERPWATYTHGNRLTTSGLARLLKPFGITPSQKRQTTQVLRGYFRADFDETFRRYLSPEAATVATVATTPKRARKYGFVAGVAGVAAPGRFNAARPPRWRDFVLQ